MTDRELMQQALDLLDDINQCSLPPTGIPLPAEIDHVMEALRARLAQPEPEELGEVIPADEEQLKRIAKLIEPEPWGYISHKSWKMPVFVEADNLEVSGLPFNNPNYTPVYKAPPHFLDPAKVARLMDEAFERGKKEIDMEQVKDIAQKLADCALLNSAPPQREWQGLTENEIKHLWYEACQTNLELTSQLIVHLARNIEAKLKEKNHG